MIALFAAALAILAPGGQAQSPEQVPKMSDRQLAGQRIVTSFPGQSPPPALRRMIRDGRVAGVILFAFNFDSEAEARALITDLRDIPRPKKLRQPLLISIDQEGGLVKRLPGPPTMSAETMGANGPRTAGRQGRKTGAYLKDLGINLNLAPVLDLGIPGGEIERANRAFAPHPGGVIEAELAFADRMQAKGVAAAAKHFPGFGRARANTDDTRQVIETSRARLRKHDERPFRAFSREGGSVVMLSNAIYPALDPGTPAGLSRRIASRELRRVAGFDGVSITDSLNAAAISNEGSPAEVARRGARAGVDLLLFTGFGAAREASSSLARGLRGGELDRDRFRKSVGRALSLRADLRD